MKNNPNLIKYICSNPECRAVVIRIKDGKDDKLRLCNVCRNGEQNRYTRDM